MSKDQQIIKILDALGWKNVRFHEPISGFIGNDPDTGYGMFCPHIDYNFMASARKKLLRTSKQEKDYIIELDRSLNPDDSLWGFSLISKYINCSPEEQIAPLLKAIGLD